MSSLQRHFGLPTDLTPFNCHSVLLIVHLLSFTRAIRPTHFHFVLKARKGYLSDATIGEVTSTECSDSINDFLYFCKPTRLIFCWLQTLKLMWLFTCQCWHNLQTALLIFIWKTVSVPSKLGRSWGIWKDRSRRARHPVILLMDSID